MTLRRVREYIPGTAESSPYQREEHLTMALSDMKTAIEGELFLPDVNASGNVNAEVVVVLFEEAFIDTPINHKLRRTARNWVACGSSDFARFKDGAKAPKNGTLYLQSDTPGVRARIMVY